MNVTRDVVKDLLTVYLAGEASEDSRALVEGWLKSDPQLAADVERARRNEWPAVDAPPPAVEKKALDRTRRYLRTRSIVLGAAIYFSTLPLAVTFGSDGFHGLLLEDWLSRAVALLAAAALWIAYWRMSRRVAASRTV
jgi:anti-sigma factor RsiW